MTAAELLAPVGWVAALHLGAWATGRRLLARVGADRGSALERNFLAGVLGFIAFAHLGFVLAAVGLLRADLLAAWVVASAVLGLWDLVKLGAFAQALAQRQRFRDLPLGLAAGLIAGKISTALYPVLRHDDAAYHLALPKTYLAAHGFVQLPFNHYANMPHAIELLYAFAFAGGGFLAAKLLSVSFAAWTLVGVAALVFPKVGRLGVGVASLLYVLAPNVQWHLGLANVEIVLGVWLLGALVALLRLADSASDSRPYAWLLGIFAGAALASKYTGWLFAAPLLLAGAFALLRAARWRHLAEMSALVAVSIVPWLVKNAVYTGNPIYPNLYGWLGGLNWSEAQSLHLARSMAFAGGEGASLASSLALPLSLVLQPALYFSEAFSAALIALFFIALITAVVNRERRAELGLLAWVALAGVLAWALGVQQGRFLVAWLPVVVVLAVWGVAPLARRAVPFGLLALAVGGSGGAQLMLQSPANLAPVGDVFRLPMQELVARNPHYDVTAYLNQAVPPGAKVLGLWENRLFFLDRVLHADTAWEAPQVLSALRKRNDAAGFAADLVAQGFTHGVITHAAWKYLDNARMYELIDAEVYPVEQLARDRELVETLLNDHTETVFESGDARVFRFR